ncbi:MAG: DUF3750 domain-containing protein [Betaproteobacteria bacterium]
MQLRYATLPFPLGLRAVHYWFVIFEPDGACHRWEVWQRRDAGGTSIGHLHCDLKAPDAGVGGGPARIAAEWRGVAAATLKRILEDAKNYPYCHRYLPWPGPNSNTFAAWVLRQAGIEHRLPWRAFGRHL